MLKTIQTQVVLGLFGAATLAFGSAAAFADHGAAVYQAQCAGCHGAAGKSDTAVAKAMSIPPLAGGETQKLPADEIAKRAKEVAKHPANIKGMSDADAAAVAEVVKGFGAAE